MRLCLLTILVTGAGWAQDLPSATTEHGAFALPDESGVRLIATAEMQGPARIRKALCSDGSNVPVQYERRQIERKDANGRQDPSQFDRLGGALFRVLRGKVEVTATCFLVGTGWIRQAGVIRVKRDEKNVQCGAALERRIAMEKKRAIVRCFSLDSLEGERRVVLTEFSRSGTDALASVVLIDRGRLLFADYPAYFRSDGEDLWRVDDGGELSAEGFRVVFVAQHGQQYALGVSWAGTEGQSLALFISGRGNVFNRVIEDYWYQMPE